ncbi:ankyrin repeat domain protein [Wolbachia endosymbiont of Trichogramma pretiosum]|nr:ankyrin repeat domain protein [Wolbachia endosymbiont of Trichogramma pretiosum]
MRLPNANDRHIEIVCSDQDSLNVKYFSNMPVKQLGKEICRVDAILEFTLKF